MSLKKTPLNESCLKIGCRMAPFAGWEMPIQYTSLINEHLAVRKSAGVFDISHMGVFFIKGFGAKDSLQKLVPTDLYRIGLGEACYSVLLNENAGIIDDLIIYDMGKTNTNEEKLLIIINANCTDKDILWITNNMKNQSITIEDYKKDGVLIALQGKESSKLLKNILGISVDKIPKFGHRTINLSNNKQKEENENIFIARTGYTGEDGFEILANPIKGKEIWSELINAGVTPCGLGARDTLRQEAAMHLYGNEMNTDVTPLEAGLGWLVHLENRKEFIGREALENQVKEGVSKKLVGIKLSKRAIARKGYKVFNGDRHIGEITSGTWSPSLQEAIAMAYVPTELSSVGTNIQVEIRGKMHQATVVKKPFYKIGK